MVLEGLLLQVLQLNVLLVCVLLLVVDAVLFCDAVVRVIDGCARLVLDVREVDPLQVAAELTEPQVASVVIQLLARLD